ncbi:hypothetical protein ACIBI3_05610 [Actinomadura luteofluorescens]|uniref:hypothetical protein n=1 Tax=Actinomadura luteofluorescens TaxID=46163 RepID=UPI003488488E
MALTWAFCAEPGDGNRSRAVSIVWLFLPPRSVSRMNEAVLDEVTALWTEHLGAPWPEELYRVDDSDGDVVEIDGAMAGCISAYVQKRGMLDAKRSRILQACARDLQKVLPRLRGDGAQYVRRLIRMADLIGRPEQAATSSS